MKKIYIILGLLIYVWSSFAQENLKKEIFAFTDSTEIIIRNGRKLVVDKTVSGDHKGAIQTLNYLKNNVDEKYVIFYPVEELLISLANRNFPLFLYDAKNYNSLMEDKTKTFQFENIIDEVHKYLGFEVPLISEDVKKSNLSPTDKEFIQLYIRYYSNDDYNDLNKDIKKYIKSNQNSEYADFLKQLKHSTTTGRMDILMGYGNEFLNGNISNYFSKHLHTLNLEVDGFVNQLYLSLFLSGSVNKAVSKYDLPIQETDLIHLKGEKVSSMKYGIKVGRKIYSTKTIDLFPYLSLGGYDMNSRSSVIDDDSSDPENTLTSTFFAGIGASCDIVLKKWKKKNWYDPEGFIFVRPNLGYDNFFTNDNISKGGDFYVSVLFGLSLSGK